MSEKQSVCFIGQQPTVETLAHDQSLMFPLFERNLAGWLPSEKNARILDFGCGYGTFLRYLKDKGFSSAEGFDPDDRCALFARQHFSGLVRGGEDSFAFLDKQRESFDSIVMLGVALYFERAKLLDWFAALRSALRPGGTLIVTVPNVAGVFGFTEFIQDPFMKSFFTDVALEDICRLTGFEVVHLGGMELPRKGLKRFVWLSVRALWTRIVKLIYLVERGKSERSPKCFASTLLLVARRKV